MKKWFIYVNGENNVTCELQLYGIVKSVIHCNINNDIIPDILKSGITTDILINDEVKDRNKLWDYMVDLINKYVSDDEWRWVSTLFGYIQGDIYIDWFDEYSENVRED